jgi:hypothetical protein
MKKIIYLSSLAGILLFLSSCTAIGYVESEPAYVVYSRPAPPSSLHVWIDGDWVFNRQSHVYVQQQGYWSKRNRGRSYVSGHWQSTPKGKTWSKGHWQKNDR